MYSKIIGIWVTTKDTLTNAIAMAIGAGFTIITQVVTQCPDLTVTLGTFSVSSLVVKGILRFLENYNKHKNDQ